MKTRLFSLLFTLLSASALHAVTITSVTPNTGLTAGGTVVTIKGTGFDEYAVRTPPGPPVVYFRGLPATSVELIDSETLRAVTPPHFAGPAWVHVDQGGNGQATKSDAFQYNGGFPEAAFERILLPVFTEPVQGAFGSRFVTELRVAKKPFAQAVHLFGLEQVCHVSACLFDPFAPWNLFDFGAIEPHHIEYTGTPGRFLYVPNGQAGLLSINLRVHDSTRSALNFGTEMPVPRERDFVSPLESLHFLGVPTDPRFRVTLRLYTTTVFSDAFVHIDGHGTFNVPLHPGENVFEPSYAVFSGFPTGGVEPLRVTVGLLENTSPISGGDLREPFWAFITVTNNETQLISTISPQP
jgi:hypothetical protein